ncbi:MAG: GntR family transcriptional regulator [Anaerolineales bacterium]|nr:GntR family transcriptional regulator [Anaerolineales bacterium]
MSDVRPHAQVGPPLRTDKLHRQVEQHLLALIHSGFYRPGERLPSEIDLARQIGVSRPTLREALLHLKQAGVVVRKHGVGTFVASAYGLHLESGLERLESVQEMAARQGVEARIEALESSLEGASDDVAEWLGIEPGAPLTTIRRTIVVDGKPVAYMVDAVLPSLLTPQDIDSSFGGSVLDVLRQQPHVHVAQAIAHIVPVNADGFLAGRLRVRVGQALLLLEELLVEDEGAPIEFSRNYFAPDCFRFHIIRR